MYEMNDSVVIEDQIYFVSIDHNVMVISGYVPNTGKNNEMLPLKVKEKMCKGNITENIGWSRFK